jgi:hypothetical protein
MFHTSFIPGRSVLVDVQVIVSSDPRTNGMLMDTRAIPQQFTAEKRTEKDSGKDVIDSEKSANVTMNRTEKFVRSRKVARKNCDVKGITTETVKKVGTVEVMLGVDRDGFVDLFMELLSSLP